MFAQVIFPVRLPQSIGPFDYSIPEPLRAKLSPGMAVWVMFRKQKKLAIVVSCSERSAIDESRVKPLLDLVWEQPVCTPQQLALAHWLASFTQSSLATVVHAFVPDFEKKKFGKSLRDAATKQTRSKKTETITVAHTISQHDEHLVKMVKNAKQQVAIIVPDAEAVERVKRRIVGKKTFFHFGAMSKKEEHEVWNASRTETDAIFIGTRNTLYLPFATLETIIICNEEDVTHQREEQHPDCSIHDLAPHVSSIYQTNCHWISVAPSFALYLRSQEKNIPVDIQEHSESTWRAIDKQRLLKQRQSPILPEDLIETIVSLPKEASALLLLNRKGFAHFIRCTSCNWQPLCPSCKSGFVYEEVQKGKIVCKVCLTVSGVPDRCPTCHGVNFKFGMPGIDELARTLQSRLLNRPILAVSKQKSELNDAATGTVFVATSYILPFAPWKDISLVVVLDFDSSLLFPDFRATEWTWQRMRTIGSRVNPSTQLFILTSYPDHAIVGVLQRPSTLPAWYAEQLQERKNFSFPPFTSLYTWKGVFSSENEKIRQEKNLISLLTQHTISASALQPKIAHSPKGYHSLILARLTHNVSHEERSWLFQQTAALWKISHNPLDLSSS